MRAGFGWQLGPFESWDALGLKLTAEVMEKEGIAIAPWIKEMIAAGNDSFYKVENGIKKY